MMGEPSAKAASLAALRKAAPFARKVLGERIRLRHVPEIRFLEDLTETRAGRIDELIHEIQEDRPQSTDEPDGDDRP